MDLQEQLSEREKAVVELLLQGKSNKQIALSLGVANRTVEFHLSNIYSKLGVTSRSEAILFITRNYPQLSKSLGKNNSRESTVVMPNRLVDNEKKVKSLKRIPMKKQIYIIVGLGLLLITFAIIYILSKNSANGFGSPQETISPGTATIVSSSIPSPQGQILTVDNTNTYTQTIGSTIVSLTLKWFYIDSARLYMELVVSGFPLPQGTMPIRIIDQGKVTVYRADGNLIELAQRTNFGGGGGGGEEEPTEEINSYFDETLDTTLKDTQQIISQTETYTLDIPVGGEVTDENGEIRSLPLATFHIQAKPSYVGQLTFTTQKSAVIEDKTINFKGLEVNPSSAAVVLCVFDPGGEQWLPTVNLLYKGNILSPSSSGLIDSSSVDFSHEMCYRLNYSYSFQFDPKDDPKTSLFVMVAKLIKDQPERLPYELISHVQNKLSAEGIEFNYVIANHSSGIIITKKPTGVTEAEALTIVQNALTEVATSSEVILFDLK